MQITLTLWYRTERTHVPGGCAVVRVEFGGMIRLDR